MTKCINYVRESLETVEDVLPYLDGYERDEVILQLKAIQADINRAVNIAMYWVQQRLK